MRNRILKSIIIFSAILSVTPLQSKAQNDNMQLKGDMRFRLESVDQEKSDGRNMARIRARAGLTARVSDTVTLVFGLAKWPGRQLQNDSRPFRILPSYIERK